MNRFAAVLLATSVVVVLFGPPLYAAWGALIAIVVAWILDPSALRAGLRFGAVLGIVFAASITAAVVTWAAGPQRGIELGGMVLLRLLVLTVAAAVLVRAVNAETLLRLTKRAGLERLGLVLGLSLNSLPRLAQAAADVWTASRVRSDSAAARLRRLPGVGEVLLAHTARIAEEAAAAASLRGHSALTRPGNSLQTPVRVVVVTGPGNGGKTETAIALVEELRRRGCGNASRRIRTQVPLAIYVPPEKTQPSQSGRFQWRIERAIARHPGVALDILRDWGHHVDAVGSMNAVQAIAVRETDDWLEGGSDRRRPDGAAVGR